MDLVLAGWHEGVGIWKDADAGVFYIEDRKDGAINLDGDIFKTAEEAREHIDKEL